MLSSFYWSVNKQNNNNHNNKIILNNKNILEVFIEGEIIKNKTNKWTKLTIDMLKAIGFNHKGCCLN